MAESRQCAEQGCRGRRSARAWTPASRLWRPSRRAGPLQRAAAVRGGCWRCSGWSPRLAGRQGFEPRLTPRSSQAGRLPLLQRRHAPPGHLDKTPPAQPEAHEARPTVPDRWCSGPGHATRVPASPHRTTSSRRTIPIRGGTAVCSNTLFPQARQPRSCPTDPRARPPTKQPQFVRPATTITCVTSRAPSPLPTQEISEE